eukprot:529003-Rhodomonas_salina.1
MPGLWRDAHLPIKLVHVKRVQVVHVIVAAQPAEIGHEPWAWHSASMSRHLATRGGRSRAVPSASTWQARMGPGSSKTDVLSSSGPEVVKCVCLQTDKQTSSVRLPKSRGEKAAGRSTPLRLSLKPLALSTKRGALTLIRLASCG